MAGWWPLEQSALFISANFCCAASCLCFSFAVFQFVFRSLSATAACHLPPNLLQLCQLLLGFWAEPEISLESTYRPHRLPRQCWRLLIAGMKPSQIPDNHSPAVICRCKGFLAKKKRCKYQIINICGDMILRKIKGES